MCPLRPLAVIPIFSDLQAPMISSTRSTAQLANRDKAMACNRHKGHNTLMPNLSLSLNLVTVPLGLTVTKLVVGKPPTSSKASAAGSRV